LIKIVLILALGIGMTGAFAELQSVNIPFPPPYETDCTYSVGEYPIFLCSWRGPAIPFAVKAELEQLERSIDILPTEEYEASKTKIIMSWLAPPDPELIIEAEPPKPTVRDQLIAKLDSGVREAVDRLAECQYGYDGWEAIQQKSFYEIPDQMIAFDGNLRNEVLVKRLNMAWQACKIQAEYPLSPSYQNFIEADLLGLDRFLREPTHTFNQTTNFTRGSEIYAPLDAMDFFKAEEKASDWLKTAPWIDPTIGCIPRDADDTRCQARGNPEPIVRDLNSYNQYINFKAGQIQTPQDYQDTIAAAKEAQCTVHYPLYKHFEELPVWLDHCMSAQEKLDRQTAKLGEPCFDIHNLVTECPR